jgi:hypothetical protein
LFVVTIGVYVETGGTYTGGGTYVVTGFATGGMYNGFGAST